MSIFSRIRDKLFRRQQPEELFRITIDGEGVKVEHPRRPTEAIAWKDVRQILIITTDAGPWQPDVWLALAGEGRGCLIPQGARGFQEVFEVVAQYEGFDFETYLQAMASTSNRKFLVWERERF